MNHFQRAIAVVRDNMDDILEGKVMSNLPDGCSDKDVSDAGEAKRPTDEEVGDYVSCNSIGDPIGVEITDDDGEGLFLTINTYIPYGEIER